MQALALALLAAVYFPIFGKIVPRIAALPSNLVNYGIVLCVGIIVASFFGVRSARIGRSPWFRYLNGFLILLFVQYTFRLLFSQLPAYELGQAYRNYAAGVIYGLATLALIRRASAFTDQGGRFFDTLVLALSVAVLLQGGLSMIESRRGEYLGDYETDVNATLEGRNLLTALGDEGIERLGFRLAFTGLMGQHNRFGSMLIYLNLLFLIQLLRTRNPYYLAMTVLCFLLALGNTTKTSIVAMAVSNVILLPLVYSNTRLLRPVLILVLVIGGTMGYGRRLLDAVYATGGEGSLLSRLDYWTYLSEQWREAANDPVSLVFGFPYDVLVKLSSGYNELLNKSFENEFLALLFRDGLTGFFAYVALLVGLVVMARKQSGQARSVTMALLVCILMSSVLMDFQLRYHNVVFIGLVLYAAFELIPGAAPRGQESDQPSTLPVGGLRDTGAAGRS